MKSYKACATVFAFTVFLVASTANATIITLADYNGPSVEAVCIPSCEGFLGPNPDTISLSLTNADDYDEAGNPTGELARRNELLAQFDPSRAPIFSVDKNADFATNSYTTSRQYFSIQKDSNLWFFENTSGGEVTIVAEGDAWAHATKYGAPPTVVIPLPATLALFGLGLAGLGWSRRKKA